MLSGKSGLLKTSLTIKLKGQYVRILVGNLNICVQPKPPLVPELWVWAASRAANWAN